MGHRRRSLTLLLALLLALSPVLTTAQAAALAAAPAEGAVATMPCHGDQGQLDRDDLRQDCPHCKHDASPSQCHCGSALSLAVLTDSAQAYAPGCGAAAPPVHCGADPLPDSPADALYRPPTHRS